MIVSGKGDAGIYWWKDQITKVIAEDGITRMDIYDCDYLTEVVIPGSVEIIYDCCNCPNLTKVTIHEGVTGIEEGAFSYCHSLAEIELPDSLVYVVMNPFRETALLETVDGVVYAGSIVVGYTNIQGSPAIREGTRIIADYAINDLDSITSVTIPDGVVRIGEDAFAYCSNLSEINVPDSVFSIGEYAFSGTKWDENQPEDAVVYAGKVAYNLYPYSGVLDLVLKEDTLAIADGAFKDCYIDTVTLPAGLKWIGDQAGIKAYKQEEIVIPDGVTHIGRGAVYTENIILPASVTYIGEGSFSDSTIIAPKGSYAETYAIENDIPYKER